MVEADDPARNRCGCSLPGLTRLATAPSADFRAGIWWKPVKRASSSSLTVHSNGRTEDLPRPEGTIDVRSAISACHARADRVAFDADHGHRACVGAFYQPNGGALS